MAGIDSGPMKGQSFGEWLRVRLPLEDRGAQKRLADAIGVVPPMVSKWAAGNPIPEPDKVLRIARYFNEAGLPVLRLAHPALVDELEVEIPAARDSRRPPHDCWATLGAGAIRKIGRLDEGHVAVLEIHQDIRKGKVQGHVDNVVITVLEALGVIKKEKADRYRATLVAGGPWR